MNSKATASFLYRNVANIITTFGFILSVILFFVVVCHREWIVTIFFLVSGVLITDFLDGTVARQLNIISKFGSAADRLRDKVFQLTMFLFIILDPRVHPWLKFTAYPLIIIEIFLLAIWLLGVKKNLNVSAGSWGKAKMFLVSVGILACPAIIIIEQRYGVKVPFVATQMLFAVMTVGFCLALMSFKNHINQYYEQLS